MTSATVIPLNFKLIISRAVLVNHEYQSMMNNDVAAPVNKAKVEEMWLLLSVIISVCAI